MSAPPARAVVVRPATPEDAAAIAAIYVQSAHHHRALAPERYVIPDPADVVERYRAGRQHPAHEALLEAVTLVAVRDDRVTGFLDADLSRPDDAMHVSDLYCYVAELAVEESERGRGTGAALLTAAEAWARERGAAWVYLEHLVSNTGAERFYRERMGYRPSSTVVMKRLGEAR